MHRFVNKIVLLCLLMVVLHVPFSIAAQDSSKIPEIAPPTIEEKSYVDEEEYNEDDEEDDTGFRDVEYFNDGTTTVRSTPAPFVNKLKSDPDFDYVKTGLKKKVIEEEESKPEQKKQIPKADWLSYVPYIAIVLFAGLLIWYLLANNFILFRKKKERQDGDSPIEEHQDLFSLDYAYQIQKALEQKNYRLAIRLQYLELLKKLTDKELIHFLPDKTNFDYLMQLRGSVYYDDFFAVTRNYEYSWYGLFDITEGMYQKINSVFQNLKQRI